ncbi:MAG: hypothetical protein ACR2P4_06120 [Gammaproteobacteria bacterium]
MAAMMIMRRGFLPGFALQKNVSPLQGYLLIMPTHGALPRAITFRPYRALTSSFPPPPPPSFPPPSPFPRKRESPVAGRISGGVCRKWYFWRILW